LNSTINELNKANGSIAEQLEASKQREQEVFFYFLFVNLSLGLDLDSYRLGLLVFDQLETKLSTLSNEIENLKAANSSLRAKFKDSEDLVAEVMLEFSSWVEETICSFADLRFVSIDKWRL
jgi:hypothetical protein